MGMDIIDMVFRLERMFRIKVEWRGALQSAFDASTLPETASAQPALNDLLIRLRTR